MALQGGYKLSTDVLIEISRAMNPADKVRGRERLRALQIKYPRYTAKS
ncbi:hypothetical protein [Candidatus Reidiella endopervernicosa]|uniref:Uncharacterized protein n=1 Tax=Candidatus Reidiella endopervernicosa TaxID=2738883 RepID=A0A6N0HS98_9GAMM|nr:hypothetical protein [Candidatus Reidiella endopervernicosa]QKQ25077.1 hypothetical protein HUE57_01345 [Candidatus Reidiella endopervernicosa]